MADRNKDRDDRDGRDNGVIARVADAALEQAENVVYAASGVVLAAGAVAVLGAVAWRLANSLGEGVNDAVTVALDGLLLVFILLELLAAIRATMVERKLVAEPFLLVGIIASIKEIVVTSLQAQDYKGKPGSTFDDAMTEVGLLGVVVVLLAIASFLVRRKEREPAEDQAAPTS